MRADIDLPARFFVFKGKIMKIKALKDFLWKLGMRPFEIDVEYDVSDEIAKEMIEHHYATEVFDKVEIKLNKPVELEDKSFKLSKSENKRINLQKKETKAIKTKKIG
jgi:hypothetical protein